MNSTDHSEIQKYLKHQDFGRADALIRELVTQEPDNADGYYFWGVMLYFQGKLGQAIEKLKQALVVNPRHTDASVCLSILYNDIGKYPEGRSAFESANQTVISERNGAELGVDHKFSIKHIELADMYFRYRRYDEAIEEYNKAVLLDPLSLDIKVKRAKACAKKGYVSRAIQDLQQIKAENPEFVPAHIHLGLFHYDQENLIDAEHEWEKALELEPTNKEARGYLEMLRGNQ